MSAFSTGKNAYGISDRSGFRYKLNDMKKEWNGLLVGPDEYEPKHPQLEPRKKVADAQALKNARPDQAEALRISVAVPLIEGPVFKPTLAISSVGWVTVTTT